MVQRRFSLRSKLIDAVFEDRLDQFLLGGKPPVYSPDAQACVVGYVVERGL
jgi:hypothetical protein